ncbi:methenyltetrahydromethanopterin cyclohydrolase [Moorella naiadis]|uniref:methenyltetrahydromethanopterin cyclohydrolase n=1 Tax=Moorella naiadis (nom. illeg.) TaxID=3093670 RepID=UPI003D9CA3B8
MPGLNDLAHKLFIHGRENAAGLGIEVHSLPNGTNVLDMGLACQGSPEAGLLYAAITMGGLGKLSLGEMRISGYSFTRVDVFTAEPVLACLGSQVAGWQLSSGGNNALGSGPARLLARLPKDECVSYVGSYHEEADSAVLCLQMVTMPTVAITEEIAARCGIKPETLYLCVAPSQSLVGAIQVAARSIEAAIYQLSRKGFPVQKITFARGSAPLAPLIKDEIQAMGRINDSLLYGATVEFWADVEDTVLERISPQVVTCNSPACGKGFTTIYREAGCNFYAIDHNVHTVARVEMRNINTGRTFAAGVLDSEMLLKSFLS